MRKQYIRWILPIVALLIIATAVAVAPALITHAAAVHPAYWSY